MKDGENVKIRRCLKQPDIPEDLHWTQVDRGEKELEKPSCWTQDREQADPIRRWGPVGRWGLQCPQGGEETRIQPSDQELS